MYVNITSFFALPTITLILLSRPRSLYAAFGGHGVMVMGFVGARGNPSIKTERRSPACHLAPARKGSTWCLVAWLACGNHLNDGAYRLTKMPCQAAGGERDIEQIMASDQRCLANFYLALALSCISFAIL